MRKIFGVVAAVFALGLVAIGAPAQANAPVVADTVAAQSIVPPAGIDTPDAVQTGANGFAMGGYPNYWTLCMANGYGPTAGVVDNWNNWGFRMHIAIQNRCTGYSITNRMTIESQAVAGAACIQFSNTHKTWSPARGKYIWDQNVVIWINTVPGCFDNNIELYHNIQKGVGYVLGVGFNPVQCECVMGSTSYDTNNIPYVTYGDIYDVVAGVGY